MPINWGICLIVTLILLFSIKDNSYAYGYLLGSVTSYLTFSLHMKYVRDFGNEKPNVLIRVLANFGTRSLIWIIILFIAYKFDNYFKLLTTGIGLAVINLFVIVFGLIYYTNRNKKVVIPKPKEEDGGVEQ